MNVLDITLASVLLFFGLAIIVFFVRSVLGLFSVSARNLPARLKLRRKERGLVAVDSLIKAGHLNQAASSLRSSFFLDYPAVQQQFGDRIYYHNLNVLSRVVTISELRTSRLNNLPLVEGLFLSRSELVKTYADITETRGKLKQKRREKGRATQAWAEEEFSRKLVELKDRLDTNAKTINAQLNELFTHLMRGSSEGEVTYH